MASLTFGVTFLGWEGTGTICLRTGSLFSAESCNLGGFGSLRVVYSVDVSFCDSLFTELKLVSALIRDFSSSVIDLSSQASVASIAGSSKENSFSSAVVFRKSGYEMRHPSLVLLSSSSWK